MIQGESRRNTMYRITGPKKEIEKIKAEMAQDEGVISIVRLKDKATSPEGAYGMEPLAYLVIVFVGHLAASLAHDQVKYLIERYLGGKRNVHLDEEKNTDADDDEDLI